MPNNRASSVHVFRSLDLADIDAVGFDLDHTLALYDDLAVNALAARAAAINLVEHLGYPTWIADEVLSRETPLAARAIAIDLESGALIKLDAGRRVRVGRHGGSWLPAPVLDRRYPAPLPDAAGRVYSVHSLFGVPTLWLFEVLARRANPDAVPEPARLCADVRRMLDLAHTNGTLKTALISRLTHWVFGVRGVGRALERWADSGKRLFVVTNSEREYATAVLDHVIGAEWRDLFDVVAVSSRKPAFFDANTDAPQHPEGDQTTGHARVLEGTGAATVEALLGTVPERVLYVGDNIHADIEPARRRGWRTVHVLYEISSSHARLDAWGPPLSHDGTETWFARTIREHADAACDRVDRLLAHEPRARLEPTAGPFRVAPAPEDA